MNKQAEYKKIYIQESDELLQLMNQNLLVLEKDPVNKDALNAIFRSAHTLKSMSASMGYQKTSDLAHRMEDVLSQLRDGKEEVTDAVVDLLFRSFDFLERFVSDVETGKESSTDTTAIIGELEGLLVKEFKFQEQPIYGGVQLNVFEKKTLARVKKDGYSCFVVKVTLEKSCVLKGVRSFMVFRSLHEIGEVIKSFPDSQSLMEEKFDFEFSCVFITKEPADVVVKKAGEVLEVAGVEADEIPVDEMWATEDSVGPGGEASGEVLASAPVEQMRRLQSVRVDIARLDKLMNLVEELAIAKLRFSDIGLKYGDSELASVVERLSRLTDELQSEVMQARLVPVGQVFDRFPRLIRDLAKKENKKVTFDVVGSDIELDRAVLDEIGDPLVHMLRNAVDHGIETPKERSAAGKSPAGRLILSAVKERSHVVISVEDDGKGMDVGEIRRKALERGMIDPVKAASMTDADVMLLAAEPGFSTSSEVTDVSGRGVGLDVVREKTERFGGSFSIESKAGMSTRISMRLPVTTAVVQALLVVISGRTFAIPIASVSEIIVVGEERIRRMENEETIIHRDSVLPVIPQKDVFSRLPDAHASAAAPSCNSGKRNVVVLEYGGRRFGLCVDRLGMQQDIVIKQLTRELKGIRGFAGATILGDGRVALVLDVATIV